MTAMWSLNEEMRGWADRNNAQQLVGTPSQTFNELDAQLNQLRFHLNSWFAKYESVFKPDERRCLVYLADEKGHGVPFPQQLEATLDNVLDEVR